MARTSTPLVTVASWLVVTALGLSIGVVGFGGAYDLIKGGGDDPVSLSSPTPIRDDETSPGEALGGGTVVAPQQIPGGQALPGSAPSARGVVKGTYTPFRPAVIQLPSGAQAPVQKAGVHADGSLEVPSDPGRVGWWTGGAQAGDPYGSIVLAGHVDSRVYGVGVMAEMLSMHPGQTVTLTSGSLAQKYRVVSKKKIKKASLAADAALFDQDVPHRLVMITCGGPFNVHTHRYRDNVIVLATPTP